MEPCPRVDLVVRLLHALSVSRGRSYEVEQVAWGLEGYDDPMRKGAGAKGFYQKGQDDGSTRASTEEV